MSNILTQRDFHPAVAPRFYHAQNRLPAEPESRSEVEEHLESLILAGYAVSDSRGTAAGPVTMILHKQFAPVAAAFGTKCLYAGGSVGSQSVSSGMVSGEPLYLAMGASFCPIDARWLELVAASCSAALGAAWPHVKAPGWFDLELRYRTWASIPTSEDIDEDEELEPTQTALRGAASFAHRAGVFGLPAPQGSVLDGEGGIIFRWKVASSSASVCFNSDGRIVAYAHSGGASTMFKLDEVYGEATNLNGLFEAVLAIR